MSASAATIVSECPHAIWRADQMGSCRNPVISTSHPALDRELPNGGWPASSLIELLLQQPGIGEMRLLRPALATIARQRRIALVQPPHLPQIAAWSSWGLAPAHLLWIKTARSADALWSAEQILRNGSCGALLFWQTHVRSESLRRLHLAAQESDIVFWMIRPLSSAQDSSPAPLRLALRSAHAGVAIDIVKRRGPRRDDALYLRLDDKAAAPFNTTSLNHAPVDRRAPAVTASRNVPAALV
ncbi:MAG: cell division protein [Burkholderiales bacterium RIFCSPLOWO2_02_FULL_57_36]|nr:MAG: cell division protein [Burkholderiales bacterium RIFCSPLOWO2_02_FULL_57_36]